MRLAARAAAAGVGLTVCDTIDSTNAEALRQASRGDGGPHWITARAQTAGRGRRGRTWTSAPGNLYASLLLRDPGPPHRSAELSFVAALAVHDALTRLAPALAPRLKLKWPNDVLADGAKLAGILIEGESGVPVTAVVGIGVNVRHHPDATEFPATDLAALGIPVTAEDVFGALSETMMERLAQWARGEGFVAVRSDWVLRAAGVGEDIRVRLPDGELKGRFADLDAAGRLVLVQEDGTTAVVAAGDVFPLQSGADATRAANHR
jgi:BirA family biotin operon repressor/biotin-[acetyl-CoA-carboxylase] ligase